MPFFSVDIYACKPFDVARAVSFTQERLRALEIEAREF